MTSESDENLNRLFRSAVEASMSHWYSGSGRRKKKKRTKKLISPAGTSCRERKHQRHREDPIITWEDKGALSGLFYRASGLYPRPRALRTLLFSLLLLLLLVYSLSLNICFTRSYIPVCRISFFLFEINLWIFFNVVIVCSALSNG